MKMLSLLGLVGLNSFNNEFTLMMGVKGRFYESK